MDYESLLGEVLDRAAAGVEVNGRMDEATCADLDRMIGLSTESPLDAELARKKQYQSMAFRQSQDPVVRRQRLAQGRNHLAYHDYELHELPLEAVKPSQHGENYDNDSSRELSKHIGKWMSSGRQEDYAPIVVNENHEIIDGNHRHAARKFAGIKTIPVLVPKKRPQPPVTLSLEEPDISDELASDPAEEVYQAAAAEFAMLSKRVRRELLAALRDGDLGGVVERGRKILEKYRSEIVALLTDTQLAAMLTGMAKVARKVKAEEDSGSPTELPSWAEIIKTITTEEPEPNRLWPMIDAAAKDLRERRLVTREVFDQLADGARAKAFTVAGVQADETLGVVRDALADAVAEGQTMQEFDRAVEEKTGSGTFLSPWHMEVVFRNNVNEAYSRGQESMLEHPQVGELFPYRAYDCIHDDRVRPNHKALETHGIQGTNIYDARDPVWHIFRPPWDWADRCGWRVLSTRQAADKGIKEAIDALKFNRDPEPHFVAMPPFRPPVGFEREAMLGFNEDGRHSQGRKKLMTMEELQEWANRDTSKPAAELSTDTEDEGRELAAFYAGIWNLLDEAGFGVSEENHASAIAEMDGWTVSKGDSGKWEVVQEAELSLEGWTLASVHAPAGGINISGKDYRGGQFIPGNVIAHASPADKAKLEASQQKAEATKAKKTEARKARGSVNTEALRSRLGKHAAELTAAEKRSAAASFRMLHRHHGELALHRVEELASGLEEALGKISNKHPNAIGLRQQFGRRLAQLHSMIEHADKAGVTGKTEAPNATSDNGSGGPGVPGEPASNGRQVAEPAARPADPGTGEVGVDGGKPARQGTARRIPADTESVNKNLDRYTNFFKAKGQHEIAGWMDKLRSHVNEFGVESALESLGAEKKAEGEDVQYAGWSGIGEFAEHYLDRHGISLVQGSVPEGDRKAVSTVAPSSDASGTKSRGEKSDVFPTLQTLKNKLDEAQHLPGLEKSEDLGKLMGGNVGDKIDSLTPEVIAKLDQTYGEGKWIVKSYGDEAYAGYGIFFPQRAKQIQQDAQKTIWDSGGELAKYGFKHLRNDQGKIVGIEHANGDKYLFGTQKYANVIGGDVKHWADAVSRVADSEKGAAIPQGSFMAQPAFAVVGVSNEERAAGVTFKKGQEGRVHIVTRNGKAEIVPHSTWLKEEHLPVVFESEETKAMAQAAVDAINALPESERKGQLYAPDIVKTADGYKVVEANPANEAGASGYLQDNPMVIDSYVSHLTGREPAHVRFIRKLLSGKKVSR